MPSNLWIPEERLSLCLARCRLATWSCPWRRSWQTSNKEVTSAHAEHLSFLAVSLRHNHSRMPYHDGALPKILGSENENTPASYILARITINIVNFCPSFISVHLIKHPDKKAKKRGQGLYDTQFQCIACRFREVKAGTQSVSHIKPTVKSKESECIYTTCWLPHQPSSLLHNSVASLGNAAAHSGLGILNSKSR